jgi:hypothetical protein
MAPALATYEPRDPSRTVLYHVIADHLETFLASLDADPDATGLPAYVHSIDTMLVRWFPQRAAVGKLLFHTRSIDHHGGESP